MTTSLIPPLGATGTFVLSSPFAALINTQTTYECMATRYLADLIKLGVDPFTKYYQQSGITPVDRSVYNADLRAGNVAIVSLKDSADNYVYIPSTYVLSYPNQGGIPYTPLVLGIDIGAVPNYLDLTALKAKIISVVHDNLGVSSTVQEIAIGKTRNINQQDHNSIEAARVANITDNTTDYAKYIATLNQLQSCQTQLTALQQYIATHLPPP